MSLHGSEASDMGLTAIGHWNACREAHVSVWLGARRTRTTLRGPSHCSRPHGRSRRGGGASRTRLVKPPQSWLCSRPTVEGGRWTSSASVQHVGLAPGLGALLSQDKGGGGAVPSRAAIDAFPPVGPHSLVGPEGPQPKPYKTTETSHPHCRKYASYAPNLRFVPSSTSNPCALHPLSLSFLSDSSKDLPGGQTR